MASPGDLDALSATELKALVVELLGKVAALEQTVVAQREEITRLKGLKGRPALNPSGMEKASEPQPPSPPKGRRGPVMPRVAVEDRILAAAAPPGSRFKGYADFLVQDLVLRVCCIRYRRERWLTPDGHLIVAPLPGGVEGHFGPELRRFVLAQYHQGQVTVPRLVALLRAGHRDYGINAEALAYMRERGLAGLIIQQLATQPERSFPDRAAWHAHLERLGITD